MTYILLVSAGSTTLLKLNLNMSQNKEINSETIAIEITDHERSDPNHNQISKNIFYLIFRNFFCITLGQFSPCFQFSSSCML